MLSLSTRPSSSSNADVSDDPCGPSKATATPCGSRESSADVNNAKSFYGRVTGTVLMNKAKQPALQLGASFGSRDRAICNAAANAGAGCTTNIAYFVDSAKYTTAFGLDAEWGGFRPGLHVIADFATGNNVLFARRINSGRNAASSF